ncbi:MAG: acetylornithine/succinylornithine family transaminase [Ruminococcaceae bacterium]|nr:acetylornithine/succinylornithine family transaminase [Oscillospiraceae bacterium]
MTDIKAIDKKYVANTYARFPVQLVSGKGAMVLDENGKEYIDMGTGIGVTAFGFADEELKKAVFAQLNLLQHSSNLYYTEPCALLAMGLCQRTGMKKVFFSNSGAESNECAIKAARKWAAEKKGSEYYNIVTLQDSFHGRTLTTLAATGQSQYHELFQPLTPGFIHAPANDLEAVKAASLQHNTAAIMIECIQGEGGVIVMDRNFVTQLADFCAAEDILLIVDEVQTGNGRTGSLFAYMQYGIMPDIVTTAKGLGGGLPLGATLLGEKVEFVLGAGDHGSTFGGNPVSCAGALSILNRLDAEFLADIRKKGEYIFSQLNGAPGVESVSGMGLMIGVKPIKPVDKVLESCREMGVLCLTAKNKLRLLPPLNIPMDTLEAAVDTIKAACTE